MKKRMIALMIGSGLVFPAFADVVDLSQPSVSQTPTVQSEAIDWRVIPATFLKQYQLQGFDAEIFLQDKSLGVKHLQVQGNHVVVNDWNSIVAGLPLKSEFIDYLTKRFQTGLPVTRPVLCPKELAQKHECKSGTTLLTARLDLAQLRLTLWLNPQLFAIQSNGEHYLPLPHHRYFSSLFNYSFSISYLGGGAPGSNTSYGLNANNTTAYGEYNVQTGFSAYRSGNDYSDSSISNIVAQRVFQRHLLSAGYSNAGLSYAASPGVSLQYPFLGQGYFVNWSTSNNMLLNKNQGSLIPINLFLTQASVIRVYRNGQLISAQTPTQPVGAYQLDTTSFPAGTYPIDVEIVQGGQVVQRRTYQVDKPFDMTGLSPQTHRAYSIWAGMARSRNKPYASIEVRGYDRPYAGFNYKTIVTPWMLANAGSYIVGNLAVGEFDSQIQLPYGASLNENAGMDGKDEYAVNVFLVKPWSQYLTTSVQYNKSNASGKVDNSPFSAANTVYGNVSLNIPRLHSSSLFLNVAHNLDNRLNRFSANYNVNLWSWHSFNASFFSSADWQSGPQSALQGSRRVDYSLGLNLNYAFDNGSSLSQSNTYQPQTGVFGSNLTWSTGSSNSNALFSSYGGAYTHGQGVDTYSLYTSFQKDWLNGSVNASQDTGNSTSRSISGSLNGGFIVTPHSISMDSVQNGGGNGAGILLDLDTSPGRKMQANINGVGYPIHSGANFIGLSPYQQYDLYLDESGNSTDSFEWNKYDSRFTLLQGNVAYLKRVVIPVTQVIGQVTENKQPMPYVKVSNHMHSTYTDENGYFIVGINQNKPSLVLYEKDRTCTVNFSKDTMLHAQPGYWVGAIGCHTPAASTTVLKGSQRKGG